MRRRVFTVAASLVVLLSSTVWAVGGFFPSNPAVFNSISYSGSGPHIKSLSTASTLTLDGSVTLLGSQASGASASDIIVKPTNSSRVGAVFETQSSASTVGVQAYDTGRTFVLSATNFPLLARGTSTNSPGFEIKDSSNTTVGVQGFAGSANAGVTGTAVGDAFFTYTNDWWSGVQANGNPGVFAGFKTLFTNTTPGFITCDLIPLADNTVYLLEIFVTARRSDGTQGNIISWRKVGAYRAGGGATLIAADQLPALDQSSGLHLTSLVIDTNANNVRIRVATPVDAEATEWHCVWSAEVISTA